MSYQCPTCGAVHGCWGPRTLTSIATTPQDAAGVERKPPDPVSYPSEEWCDEYAEWHEWFTTKAINDTTPPPGVDVGKLRELRELVVDLRKDASGGEGYNYTAYEEGRIAEKRYCAHRLAEIIGAAAPGVQS